MADDLQRWLDALAGRETGESPAQREAAALRHAMIQRAGAEAPAEAQARDSEREAQLIERARRAGIIDERDHLALPWWKPLAAVFAVTLVAAFGIAIYFEMQGQPHPGVVRATPDGIVRLEVENPGELKQHILDDLRAVGVKAIGYELLGRHGVDADLPMPLSDDVRKVLERYRIPAPADGVLRVEIVAKDSP